MKLINNIQTAQYSTVISHCITAELVIVHFLLPIIAVFADIVVCMDCRHCHYAHHLARPQDGNIIGLWIHELLESKVDEENKEMEFAGDEHETNSEYDDSREKDTAAAVTAAAVAAAAIESCCLSAMDTPGMSRGISSLSGGDSTIPGDDNGDTIENELPDSIAPVSRSNLASLTHTVESDANDNCASVSETESESLRRNLLSEEEDATAARKAKFESSGMFRFIYEGSDSAGDLEAGEGEVTGYRKTSVRSSRCFDDSCRGLCVVS